MSEFEERRISVSTSRTVSGDDQVDGFFLMHTWGELISVFSHLAD